MLRTVRLETILEKKSRAQPRRQGVVLGLIMPSTASKPRHRNLGQRRDRHRPGLNRPGFYRGEGQLSFSSPRWTGPRVKRESFMLVTVGPEPTNEIFMLEIFGLESKAEVSAGNFWPRFKHASFRRETFGLESKIDVSCRTILAPSP